MNLSSGRRRCPTLRSLPRRIPAAAWPVLLVLVSLTSLAQAQDTFEPNDTPAQAHVITQSGTPLSSFIFSEGDRDWFTFTQTETGPVTITLTSIPSNNDYDLCFYEDPEGTSICSEEFGSKDEGLEGTLEPGTYFLEVYGFEGFSTTDSYVLTVTFSGGGGGNTAPTVSISQPAGGEQYTAGSGQTVSYTLSDLDGDTMTATVEYSTNGGSSWTLINSTAQSSGSFQQSWTVPSAQTSSGRIRVSANDGQATGSAQSNAFTITIPQSGDNSLALGTTSGEVGSVVAVILDLDNEDTVKGIQVDVVFDPAVASFTGVAVTGRAASLDASGSTISSGRARIVIFPETTPTATIAPGTGTVANLSFSLTGVGTSSLTLSGAVLSDPDGIGLSVDTSDTGSITASAGGSPPAVTLVAPNGGEVLTAGSVGTIQYVASGGQAPLSVSLDYSNDGGGSWNPIVAGLSNSGSFKWSVSGTATNAGRVRVTVTDGVETAQDQSDGNFTIRTQPSGGNVVSVGSASGASGATVVLSLDLDNDDTMKALQFDLTFDSAVASFVSAIPTGRGSGLVADATTVSPGRARVVLYFNDNGTLSPAQGTVANLSFRLTGGLNAQTTITPTAIVFSDPDANPVTATGQAGVATVNSGPEGAPAVQLAVLKNPGNPRALMLQVVVEQGSGSTPQVTVGGSAVSMTGGADGVYRGQFFAAAGVNSVVVQASDTNTVGTGTDSKTVSF